MKLLISIGPDLIGVNYKTKKSCYDMLSKLTKKKTKIDNPGHLHIKFKGKLYCTGEVKDALVFTLSEFHTANTPD
jgi:hypothetical protein